MSGQGDFDQETSRRNYTSPHNAHHPIPTVQRYRAQRDELESHQKDAQQAQPDENDDSKTKQAFSAVKQIFKGEDEQQAIHNAQDPYPTTNRNTEDTAEETREKERTTDRRVPPRTPAAQNPGGKEDNNENGEPTQSRQQGSQSDHKNGKQGQTGAEANAGISDPRQKRKNMKHMKRNDGGREVTDPVTHLPIIIRDSTPMDLKKAPENEPTYGSEPRTSTGLKGAEKPPSELDAERDELQRDHAGMKLLFPPPSLDDAKAELTRTYQLALTVGLGSIVSMGILVLLTMQLMGSSHQNHDALVGGWQDGHGKHKPARLFIPLSITVVLSIIGGGALIVGLRGWLGKKVEEIWDDEVWDAARKQEVQRHENDSELPESVAWLNSIVTSVWPLINPDLFTSIGDMLEDVMQASLPKLVRMVSVDDLGQGTEAIRILGIRWLPTGAASQTVDNEGNLEPAQKSQEQEGNDRTESGQGQVDSDANNDTQDKNQPKGGNSEKDEAKRKADEQEQEAMRQGMEAEQGDFVNVELAFAYRARTVGKSMKSKAKNAHLYLKFYFPGNIAVPVWVELRGIIGTMRLRLQLTPDPPFFSMCTLTFLGQPKADLSCVPLSKHSLNLMDVPLISGFVQSSIDAALAEYVAPKSLTLDLKDMLVGDDFKKDTTSRGVLAVFIKSAKNFKEGDGGFGPFAGSSDGYVSVSWGKYGKPMATTRIIVDEQWPRWYEWAYILVGPEELNAQETLRLQLWDSDKYSADDDLGRVEVSLKELMQDSKTKNKICDREDRFTAEDPKEEMPGTIAWSVGYFERTEITQEQFEHQTEDPSIKTKEDLKKKVSEGAERKLREATIKDESRELHQQKVQDYDERENMLIISAPPDDQYPSGILSIQVHNITGLELERLRKRHGMKNETDHTDDPEDDELPSSYASIILNHQKIYKTRTKPKNSKPFFNAGTERFVKDWRTAEVIVSVRDNREGENDALLGVVYLPLRRVFEKRSQTNDTYPLAGGIGYGRARISMVFRSTQLQAPKELIGWDYGTVELKAPIKVREGISDDLTSLRLTMRSNLGKAKMYAQKGEREWRPKHDKSSVFLPVRDRYACPVIFAFRKSTLGPDRTAAFAVFWLKDIPDEEEKTVTVQVWKGSRTALKRASSCEGYDGQEDGEKPLGQIEVKLLFWRGLGGYHQKWADKASSKGRDRDVKQVMEVLDVVGDVEGSGEVEDQSGDSSDDSSGTDEESSGENHEDEGIKDKMKRLVGQGDDNSHSDSNGIKGKIKEALDSHNQSDDTKRGPVNQVRDYKDHHRQLHRRHRGVMQWRAVRKLDWMGDKMKQAKGKIEGVFEHGEREPGVETEA